MDPARVIGEVQEEIERIVTTCRHERIDGVASTGDYPGSALAGIVAQRPGLPGVSPRSVGTHRVDDLEQLPTVVSRATLPAAFFAPFRALFQSHAGEDFGEGSVRTPADHFARRSPT